MTDLQETSENPDALEPMGLQQPKEQSANLELLYDWISRQKAGPNVVPHITGKFAKGWIPGLKPFNEWQSVIPQDEVFSQARVFPHQDPDFLLVSAIQANLSDADKQLGSTNMFITTLTPQTQTL